MQKNGGKRVLKPYLEAGEFVTTHGVAGELRLYPFGDNTDFLARFKTLYLTKDGGKPVKVALLRPHKNICIVKLEGVDSIEAARPYIGKTAWISREDAQLPEGRVFVQDILGAEVDDADSGQVYGEIVAVTHPGRHDVYEIEDEEGQRYLFPATEPFLDTIDVQAGKITVRPIPGMFWEERPGVGSADSADAGKHGVPGKSKAPHKGRQRDDTH